MTRKAIKPDNSSEPELTPAEQGSGHTFKELAEIIESSIIPQIRKDIHKRVARIIADRLKLKHNEISWANVGHSGVSKLELKETIDIIRGLIHPLAKWVKIETDLSTRYHTHKFILLGKEETRRALKKTLSPKKTKEQLIEELIKTKKGSYLTINKPKNCLQSDFTCPGWEGMEVVVVEEGTPLFLMVIPGIKNFRRQHENLIIFIEEGEMKHKIKRINKTLLSLRKENPKKDPGDIFSGKSSKPGRGNRTRGVRHNHSWGSTY